MGGAWGEAAVVGLVCVGSVKRRTQRQAVGVEIAFLLRHNEEESTNEP